MYVEFLAQVEETAKLAVMELEKPRNLRPRYAHPCLRVVGPVLQALSSGRAGNGLVIKTTRRIGKSLKIQAALRHLHSLVLT